MKFKYETHVQTGTLLNANERSLPLEETLREEIAAALKEVAFNRYPDSSQTELRSAYAEVIGVDPGQLIAGNGSDQILGYLIGTFLGPGKKLMTLDPDFSMYDYYASSYGASVIKYPIDLTQDFSVRAFIAWMKEQNGDMILFSNPNNPSGICLDPDAVREILNAFTEIPVVIDEAYIEFADTESSAGMVNEYPNLYVTRTLSKAFGLAGIRTGFLVTSVNNAEPLREGYVPYALNTLSMKTASIVLSHAEELLQYAENVKKERRKLYEKAAALKCLKFYPSQANFLYGESAHKQRLLEEFAKAGIVIRDYRGKDAFRITIGTEEENRAVWEVLQTVEETL
ncbi:MAG: histidinol-phosphate transaminase [Solobacterium sp.]|nr:histidinol-phosphate transaminase [Solobacterium sp.]